MSTNRTAPAERGATQYLVQCERCAFEQSASGQADATAIGTDHHHETGHEVVAIEVPPSRQSA